MYNPYCIRFGKYSIALLSQRIEIRESLKAQFIENISDSPPDVSILIHDNSAMAVSAEPGMRYLYKNDEKTFNLGPDIIRGTFNPEKVTWDISLNTSLLESENIWLFNRILCRLFYSLRWSDKTAEDDVIIIHSSGIFKDRKGYIFFGPPGSGKSTVAHLSRQFKILNDDMNILTIGREHVSVEGVPFNPGQLDFFSGRGPLTMICSLHKNNTIKRERGSSEEFAMRVLPEVFLPLPLLSENRKYAFQYLLHCVKKLANMVPYYRLYFRKDESFWDIMREEAEV